MPRSGLPLIPHRHVTVAWDARDRPVTVSLMGGAIERPSGVGTATRGGRVRPPFVVAAVSRSRCRRRPVSGRAAEAGFERSVGEVVRIPAARAAVVIRVGTRSALRAAAARKCRGLVARGDRPGGPRLEKLVAVPSPGPGAPVLDRHDPGHQSALHNRRASPHPTPTDAIRGTNAGPSVVPIGQQVARCRRRWQCRAFLPAAPVHNLLEGPTVRSDERPERPVCWVTKSDQVHTEVAVRKPQYAPRLLLVRHSRVPGSDAEVGRGQHYDRGRLAEVVHQQAAVSCVIRLPGYQGDRCRRPGLYDLRPATPLPTRLIARGR
jgi:hypothetical protein